MKRKTIAIHSGYETDPTTKAVAVPIYQTVAYSFDSTEHTAALFNWEAEGYRYTRISKPTTAALERRVVALEGGMEAMCVPCGQGGFRQQYYFTPQLYGTAHTLFAHLKGDPDARCSQTVCRRSSFE